MECLRAQPARTSQILQESVKRVGLMLSKAAAVHQTRVEV